MSLLQSRLCESVTPEKFEDAAHRAYQDNRALIRYCKANATALGIDSNKIYLMGISSGGFLVLHHLYVNDASIDADRIARLGKLDNQSNYLYQLYRCGWHHQYSWRFLQE
jgi:carboxylesterase type B